MSADLWIAPYELHARMSLSSRARTTVRRGVLLRVGGGFADVHPWPELGDAPIEDQIESILSGAPLPLAARSLRFAEIDAAARDSGTSLFASLEIPQSHFLLPEEASPGDLEVIAGRGYDRIKLKAGRDEHREARYVNGLASALETTGMLLRIDMNASFDATQLRRFLGGLAEQAKSGIEFLEDPCPYDVSAWTTARNDFGIRLAADREKTSEPDAGIDVLVIKPAIEESPTGETPIVVTSYMDHPVGQMFAAWEAARLAKAAPARVLTCGLLTHSRFERDDFIDHVVSHGPKLLPTEGTGIGFDDLLKRQPWRRAR